MLTNFAIIYFYFQSLRSFKNCNIFILANVYVPHHTDGVWKCCHMWLNAVRKGLRLRSIDRFCPLMQTAIDWLQVKMLNLWCPVLAIIHKIRTTFCSFQWIPYIESLCGTKKVTTRLCGELWLVEEW